MAVASNVLVNPKVNAAGFLNTQYALDLALMQFFADNLFSGDLSFMIYVDDAFCFQKRTNQNNGTLKLPFMHLKAMSVTQDDPLNWYSAAAAIEGVWFDTLQTKVYITPVQVAYESNIWCASDLEARTLLNTLMFTRQNHQLLHYNLTAVSPVIPTPPATRVTETLTNTAIINFEKLETGTEFAEKDWLEKNQLFQINTRFTVNTFALRSGAVIYPWSEIMFSFCPTIPVDATLEEQYRFVVDQLNGTLTEV